MNSEWQKVKLKDVVEINPKESIKKGKLSKKIAMDKLKPFCRDITDYELTTFNGGSKFRNEDIIMASITPCLENGKIAKVNILDENEVGFGSTEYIIFRAIDGITNADFIYYLICSNIVREPAIKSMVGTSGRQRVQKDVVANLEITIPPYNEQVKISSILKSLDDKIELNNRINKNLEQQTQAIFKSWFIDFEPFDEKILKSWSKIKLNHIAKITTNTFSPIKNKNIMVEHYSIPAFDDKHYPIFESTNSIKSDKYILNKNSVIISKLNPNIKRIWRPICLSNYPICSTEFIVYESINPKYKDFIYSVINSLPFYDYICSNVNGTTNSHQRTNPKLSLDYEFLLPTEEIIKNFCSIVTPMYDLISSNLIENQNLINIREVLLPKLMSDEIDVYNINF